MCAAKTQCLTDIYELKIWCNGVAGLQDEVQQTYQKRSRLTQYADQDFQFLQASAHTRTHTHMDNQKEVHSSASDQASP